MKDSRPTLLVVNVHFSPNSFGGATVVAENMVVELASRHGWKVVVLTTHQDIAAHPYSIVRYTSAGAEVFSVVVPDEGALPYEERYDNVNLRQIVEELLDRVAVDVAHVHSIQSMGLGVIASIKNRGVPVATTVHDCWWFCERMFMVDIRGKYCHQTKIDMNICRYCVVETKKAETRKELLSRALSSCDLLLFPSEFQRQLYLQNGFDPDACRVNKNGIKLPAATFSGDKTSSPGSVRFGFVGGPGDIKGAPLIKAALMEIKQSNYELVVVDGAQNRGLTWKNSFDWDVPGRISVIPPYNRDTMDDFFASLDVLLFPSQWKESFGLTVREAIARGVWVVATDAGGVAEDCIEGQNANVIPMDGDYRPLKKAMESILVAGCPPRVTSKQVVSIRQQADELNDYLVHLHRTAK